MLQLRARECLIRLRSAEAAKDGVEEARALDGLLKDLAAISKRARDTCIKAKLLRGSGIPVAPTTEVAKQKKVIATVADRFREKPEAATLRQGQRWTTLMDAVKEAARSIDASLTSAWQNYVNSNLFAGPSPDEEERSLRSNPKNRDALNEYRSLFDQFSRLRGPVPTESGTIAHLQKLSSELAAIRFQRNVPHSVRLFLDATNTMSGAGLDLFTDEVRGWLAENDLLESYVIRAKVTRG